MKWMGVMQGLGFVGFRVCTSNLILKVHRVGGVLLQDKKF